MKEKQIIIQFRRAYLKLEYTKGKMKLYDLLAWAEDWCRQNSIPQALLGDFKDLAIGYMKKEWNEENIARYLKRH